MIGVLQLSVRVRYCVAATQLRSKMAHHPENAALEQRRKRMRLLKKLLLGDEPPLPADSRSKIGLFAVVMEATRRCQSKSPKVWIIITILELTVDQITDHHARITVFADTMLIVVLLKIEKRLLSHDHNDGCCGLRE